MSDDFKKILSELKEIRRALASGQKKLLTVDEAASALGISAKSIRNRLSSKDFPIKAVKLTGRTLFKVSDIDKLVERLGAGDG
jgi:predicted DNA-binding transcriptional regulator AlpA